MYDRYLAPYRIRRITNPRRILRRTPPRRPPPPGQSESGDVRSARRGGGSLRRRSRAATGLAAPPPRPGEKRGEKLPPRAAPSFRTPRGPLLRETPPVGRGRGTPSDDPPAPRGSNRSRVPSMSASAYSATRSELGGLGVSTEGLASARVFAHDDEKRRDRRIDAIIRSTNPRQTHGSPRSPRGKLHSIKIYHDLW